MTENFLKKILNPSVVIGEEGDVRVAVNNAPCSRKISDQDGGLVGCTGEAGYEWLVRQRLHLLSPSCLLVTFFLEAANWFVPSVVLLFFRVLSYMLMFFRLAPRSGFHTSCPVGLGQLNNQEAVAQGCPAWYRAATGWYLRFRPSR